MTIWISPWWIPPLLTILIWAAALLWPLRSGTYGVGAAVQSLWHAVLALIATLSVWMIAFAVAAFA